VKDFHTDVEIQALQRAPLANSGDSRHEQPGPDYPEGVRNKDIGTVVVL